MEEFLKKFAVWVTKFINVLGVVALALVIMLLIFGASAAVVFLPFTILGGLVAALFTALVILEVVSSVTPKQGVAGPK